MSALSDSAKTEPSLAQSLAARFADWAVNSYGSSRSSGLLRIGIALLFWSRWAGELLLYMDQSAIGLLVSVNFFIATSLLLIGYHSRIAAIWTGAVGLTIYYYFGHELGRESWTHHHTYLLAIAALLVGLSPCDRSYSLDRYLAVGRAKRAGETLPLERGNLWGLRLMVVQLSVLYFFAALDKSNFAFLSGARLEHIFMWFYSGSDYPALPGFHALAVAAAWTVVAVEYALAFGLPFQRARRYLIWPGIAFHAILYITLPVYTFSATMILLYLAYLDADAVDKVTEQLHGRSGLVGENTL